MHINKRKWLLDFLSKRVTDRVPVIPFIHENFIREFYRTNDIDPVENCIKIYEHFGFDIILRTCNVWGYLDESYCDDTKWRVSTSREGGGDNWSITTTIKTPEKELTQVKKYYTATTYETVEAVVEYFIKDEDDFSQFVKYQPDVPEYDCAIIGNAREKLEGKGLAAPWIQGAFNSVSFYRKLDDLLIDPYINYKFYKHMIEYFSGRMLEVAKQFAKAGADMVCYGGNVGNGSVTGPNYFRKYILPYEIDLINKVRASGLYTLYHNCGDAKSLFGLYSEMKMDIFESLTAPPYGDTILEHAMEQIDKNIILAGNIDQIDFLRIAAPAEIKREVERVLRIGKQRGNFILGTSDYLSEGTPHENIFALAEAGMEYGKY